MKKQESQSPSPHPFSQIMIVVEDGLTGTENQLSAVADRLGGDVTVHTIRPSWWEKLLAPYAGRDLRIPITEPESTLILCAGRQATAPAIRLKKHYPALTLVALQDPGRGYEHFDLMAAPAHDGLVHPHAIQTVGAPTKVMASVAEQAKAKHPALGDLPSPRIAVLIGGTSKRHRMDRQSLNALLHRLEQTRASFMITASRRSGADTIQQLQDFCWQRDDCFLWDGTGPNPYHAMLGWADHIFVTQDSVSMISDAASTGKPITLLPLSGRSGKLDVLYKSLELRGALQSFAPNASPAPYPALRDAADVAEAIISLKTK